MNTESKYSKPLRLSHDMATESPAVIRLRKMNIRPRGLTPILCAFVLGFATLAGCSSKEEKPAPPPPGVTIAPVLQKDVPIHQEWVGTMVGNVDADIRPKVEGFLLTRLYTEGSYVTKGQPMFQLDMRQAQAAVEQATGNLERARAALNQTQIDVRRFTPLVAQRAVSQAELDKATSSERAATASVDADQAALDNAKLNLGWTTVTSPISGIAGVAKVGIGDLMTPTTVMTTVSSVNPIYVDERRPDLQQAEEALIAANANVGVAKANFFPTISLTGVLGGVSPQLSELTGAGRAWSLAGNLAGPLFTAGRLKNEYRAALAQRDQAKITFEKSVTQAFGEVSTSLSAHQELAKAYKEQLNSVEAYRESVRLSSIRYDSGLASCLEIIDAQIQMYPAERSAIIYDLERKEALVNLYRALGGGWNLNDSQWISTSGASAPAQSPTP
jgi:RND family efflux transporter MFP subunit